MIIASKQHISATIAGIILSVVAMVALSYIWGPAGARVITVFFISLIAVVGMGIYSGNSGILSFGHLSFMAIGAYSSSLLTMSPTLKSTTLPNLANWLASIQLSLPLALVVAIAFTILVALFIGLAIGKLEGSAATITTLGLLIVVHGVIIGWKDVTRGAKSFFGVPRETDIWTAAIACILALVIARLYRDSISGLRLRAGRENAIAASAAGVNIRFERLISWIISAGVVALAGGLLVHFLGAFSVKKFYFVDTFFLLSMLIVGGMTTVTGAVFGTAIITIVTEILRRLEGGFTIGSLEIPPIFGTTNIGIGLIILLVMFKKANGLSGYYEWEERIFGALGNHLKSKKVPKNVTGASDELQVIATTGSAGYRLEATSITMQFGGLTAVNDVSIVANSGEILGLIGPNGSGKTTLLNVLSGVLISTKGNIKSAEQNLTGLAVYAFPKHGIARTFQNVRLFGNLSVYQNVLVAGLTSSDSRTAHDLCENLLLRMSITDKAGMRANTLSYGDQRRVEIARALALRPSLLFLDEPAAGMNREETDDLMNILRRLVNEFGIGILLVDHDLKLINDLCDRVIVLNEGRLIAQGTPDEIKTDPMVIEAYLGHRKSKQVTEQLNVM